MQLLGPFVCEGAFVCEGCNQAGGFLMAGVVEAQSDEAYTSLLGCNKLPLQGPGEPPAGEGNYSPC